MRRLVAPVSLLLLSALHVAQGGCSSSSSLVGEGACEAFCNKWVGARCRNSPTREMCLTECFDHRTRCRVETNASLHCATIEGTIACETGSGLPKVIGCGPSEIDLSTCLSCDRFCESWTKAPCANTPTRSACNAFCQDTRCEQAVAAMLSCANFVFKASCNTVTGTPYLASVCTSQLEQVRACAVKNGTPVPFDWLPPPRGDAGDGGDAADGDAHSSDTGTAFPPGEDFDATGGLPGF